MKNTKREFLDHSFGPFYRSDSEILILGSFPSVKSREQNFYYGHPQNRFWKILAAIFHDALPASVEEKRSFLARHKIALYDVIDQCSIIGSSDSSIEDVVVTDLAPILQESKIRNRIFTNGGKAFSLYMKYTYPKTGIRPVKLPSSSPANAAWSLPRLTETWKTLICNS
jgi:TDG/mug DNA glycosylase family protein